MLTQYKLLKKNCKVFKYNQYEKNTMNEKKICYISKKEKFYAALEEEVITIKKKA